MLSKIGIIASSRAPLTVQRDNQPLVLTEGDPIYAGDVLQNPGPTEAKIALPAQQAGFADAELVLAPNATAQIDLKPAGPVEITPLSPGVELYITSEGEAGTVLAVEEGVTGLVGTGLLAAGSASSLGGLATVIGGGVGVAALTTASGDSTNTPDNQFTDVPVDNPTPPDEQPPANETPETPADEEPESPPPVEDGVTGTPLDLLLDPLADLLGGTPLAVITDPVFDLLGTLPIGSAPNPAEALPLDMLTNNLPG